MDPSHSNTPSSRSNTPTVTGRLDKSISAKSTLLANLQERSKKRMEMYSKLIDRDKEDEVDLFMRSMALMLKKLTPNLINQAKLQILTLVTNLQASMDNPEQPQKSTPPVQTSLSGQQFVYLQIPANGEPQGTPAESVNVPQPTTLSDVNASANPQYKYTPNKQYLQL